MRAQPTVEEEFREFVVARSAALLRTAYLLAGDWASAEDLLQTALTKTYLAWKRLGEIGAVEPYARRVLVNTATSWWRRRWHGERPTEVLPERAVPDDLDARLERDLLWRHIRALPARQRAVLVLRYYEDLSEAQTAELLGVSVGTVKSQCARALTTLRRRLEATAAPVGAPTPSAGRTATPTPERRATPVPERTATGHARLPAEDRTPSRSGARARAAPAPRQAPAASRAGEPWAPAAPPPTAATPRRTDTVVAAPGER